MITSDLIIIGSGPGGYHTATYAAKHGLSVTIIEKEHVGGTCLNAGCIPTKCLAHDADLLRNPLLSCVGGGLVDFKRIYERKQQVIENLRGGIETLLSQPNITLVHGEASFVDAHTVQVGEEQYTATDILIATGSEARLLPFMDPAMVHEGSCVMTSTELLNTKTIPSRLCIIGAGVIGMEFASAFSSFGSEVTVIEFLKECLPPVDADIAKRLRKCLEKRGVTFHMQSGVTSITPTEQNGVVQATVCFSRKGETVEVEADAVLVATGRRPRIEGLQLEAVGVAYTPKGITVDEYMTTNVPHIYAIGDVNGQMMLAHAASFQGMKAVNHILGKEDNIRLDVMPSAIFTYPEAASVGPTEATLKEQHVAYTCKKGYYRANGKALAIDETEGMLKLFVGEDHLILGCHAYGAHAADLVQEVAALMNRDTTIDQLADMVHIHPTLSEILSDVAH